MSRDIVRGIQFVCFDTAVVIIRARSDVFVITSDLEQVCEA